MTDKQFYTDLLAKEDWELRPYFNLLDNQHDHLAEQVGIGREEKRDEFNRVGHQMTAVEMERVRRLGDPAVMLNDRGLQSLFNYCWGALGVIGEDHPKAEELRKTLDTISDIWAQDDRASEQMDEAILRHGG